MTHEKTKFVPRSLVNSPMTTIDVNDSESAASRRSQSLQLQDHDITKEQKNVGRLLHTLCQTAGCQHCLSSLMEQDMVKPVPGPETDNLFY